MSKVTRLLCIPLSLMLALGAVSLPADDARADAASEVSAGGDFETAWEHLEQGEPFASHALLQFAARPDEAVAFLRPRLLPLTIDEQEVRDLLSRLGNEHEEIWRPATEKLEYFDPRLAIDLETLMEEVREFPARQRMVWILSGRAPDKIDDTPVNIRKVGEEGFNFTSGNGSWWAEHKVERLSSEGWGNRKPKWTRAVRAIVLLEHIGTTEACAIVEAMATGHPDAEPTRTALGVLEARKIRAHEPAGKSAQ